MLHARATTLTFFVMYLSPQKPKACAAKIDLFFTYAGCSFSGCLFYMLTSDHICYQHFFWIKIVNCIFGLAFHGKILSFKIAMSGVGRCSRFTFLLTLFFKAICYFYSSVESMMPSGLFLVFFSL